MAMDWAVGGLVTGESYSGSSCTATVTRIKTTSHLGVRLARCSGTDMRLFLSIAAAIVFIAALVFVNNCKLRRRDAEGHQLIYAKRDLVSITEAVKVLSYNEPEAVADWLRGDLNAYTLYALLNGPARRVRTLDSRAQWEECSCILDRWGNPLRMKAQVTTNASVSEIQAALTFWSLGPNGRNDAGPGDDLKVEVNLAISHQ